MITDATAMVRVEGTSIDGPLVGKYLSREKFEHCLPDGICLADFVLAMDLAGTPQLGWWGDWRQPALGDMYLRPDLSTAVTEPDAPDIVSYLGSFTDLERHSLARVPTLAPPRADPAHGRARIRGQVRLRARVLRRGGVHRSGSPPRVQGPDAARRRTVTRCCTSPSALPSTCR